MKIDAQTAAEWKRLALGTATRPPLAQHTLDQVLAAARDGGLTEREQGVLVLAVTFGDLERHMRHHRHPSELNISRMLAVAVSMTIQMLDEAPD